MNRVGVFRCGTLEEMNRAARALQERPRFSSVEVRPCRPSPYSADVLVAMPDGERPFRVM